jgi:hypothetical protein
MLKPPLVTHLEMELTLSGKTRMFLGRWQQSDKQMVRSKDSKLVRIAHIMMNGNILLPHSKRTI